MSAQIHNLSRHIYLADDDSDDRNLFADALSEVDNSVVLTQFENGIQLTEALCEKTPNPLPDIVFLDINMPALNGLECLEKIGNKIGENVHIVMLTTSRDRENIKEAFELGATFYAVKPNTFPKLKELIDRTLRLEWPVARCETNFLLT